MPRFTPQQIEAIKMPTTTHCAISAVPGSGKSTMLVGRIKNLVKKGEDKQLIITFTKKAAEHLKAKLEPVPESVFVGTFHSLCFRLLKTHSDILKDNKLLDGAQEYKLFLWASQVLSKSHTSEVTAEGLVKLTSSCASPEDLTWASQFGASSAVPRLVRTLFNKVRSEGYLLFQELLVEAIHLLEENDDLLKKVQSHFPIIMVDEFQDTDPIQVRLIQLILGDGGHLTVVGNISQSLYSFRGATPEVLLNVGEHFGKVKCLSMTKNFRSVDSILAAANNLMRNSELEDVIIDVGEDVEPFIQVGKYGTVMDEARAVVDKIIDLGEPYLKSAVLYRSNSLSGPIESALALKKVPYDIGSEKGFFDIHEIKTILSYLELCIDINRPDSLRWIWNRPTRFLKSAWLNKAAIASDTTNAYHIVSTAQVNSMGVKQRSALQALLKFLEKAQDYADQDPSDVIRSLVKRFNFKSYLKEVAAKSSFKEYDLMVASIGSLLSIAKEFPTVRAFLAHVENAKSNYKKKDKDVTGVSLMTIHKSKGLEFPHVFLIGATSEELPHKKSTDIEEERRIMYVACTRAELTFEISYTGTASPFICEFKTKDHSSGSSYPSVDNKPA